MNEQLIAPAPPAPRRFYRPLIVLLAIVALTAALLASAMLYASSGRVPVADELAPPDTATPQSTLAGLQREVATAEAIIRPAFEKHIHSPGLFASAETDDAAALARAHLDRAMRYLDLSTLAPTSRERVGTERVLMLGEILERVAIAKAIGDAPTPAASVDRWNVPGTDIRIGRIPSGPRAGEFLFSSGTVDRIPDYYAAVYRTPDQDDFDFYKFYALSPGDLIPPKWYGLVLKLPDWALDDYGDQALWQWAGFALVLALFVVATVSSFALGRTRLLGAGPWRRLIRPLGCLLAALVADILLQQINITGATYQAAKVVLHVVAYLAAAWAFLLAMLGIANVVASASGMRPKSIDAGMLRLALRILGVVGAGCILAYGASELGVPLMGIVAGLGVGGLAVALAAQPTLENLIGGVIIFADRPVRVGDQCKFGDISGTVEEIGIRSTRVRAADRTLITIPNADFSKQRLINTDRRDYLVVNAKVGLRYGTKASQLRDILQRTAGFFAAHPMIDGALSKVRLVDFGMNSVDIELAAQLTTADQATLSALREEILLQFAGIVEQAGTGFAERVPAI